MPGPEDREKVMRARQRTPLNMRSIRENTLGPDLHLLKRETWKDNATVARAILNNASLGELIEGRFLSKDAPFLRVVQKEDEDDKDYVDRLWRTKMGRCANKGACRAVWESLRNAEVRRMDMEVFVNTVSMELQGMKEKFDNKYFQILDEKSFVALAVQEITPSDFDGYVRIQLFDMALQEGDLTKVPSHYDESVSFGPWQMTKTAYEDLLKRGGDEAGLPAKFSKCTSYELQARAAIFYGYRRILQISEVIEGSAALKKIFESVDNLEQRKFLTALLAKGHNGGSGRLESALYRIKMAAADLIKAKGSAKVDGNATLAKLYAYIFKNSENTADGLYSKNVLGIYNEL